MSRHIVRKGRHADFMSASRAQMQIMIHGGRGELSSSAEAQRMRGAGKAENYILRPQCLLAGGA